MIPIWFENDYVELWLFTNDKRLFTPPNAILTDYLRVTQYTVVKDSDMIQSI